jgi:hypothetical protein
MLKIVLKVAHGKKSEGLLSLFLHRRLKCSTSEFRWRFKAAVSLETRLQNLHSIYWKGLKTSEKPINLSCRVQASELKCGMAGPTSTKEKERRGRDSNETRFFEAGFSDAHNTLF